jgi:hypothetical protein
MQLAYAVALSHRSCWGWLGRLGLFLDDDGGSLHLQDVGRKGWCEVRNSPENESLRESVKAVAVRLCAALSPGTSSTWPGWLLLLQLPQLCVIHLYIQ